MPPVNVYLIPGIAGSTLKRKRWIIPDEQIWLPNLGLAGLNTASLALAPNGVDSALGPNEKIYPVGLLRSYYGPLYDRLTGLGYAVKTWAYDWRLSVARNAELLAADVAAQPAGQSFAFVAHSMGGLIAKLAWAICDGTGVLDRISRVVTLGTPWRGSFELPRVAAHADERWMPYFRLLGLLTRGYSFHSGLQLIDNITSTWPGFHELVPLIGSYTGFGPVPDKVADINYYRTLNQSITQSRLDAGQTVLRAVQGVNADPARWVVVRGTKVRTAQTIIPNGHLQNPGDYVFTDDGDGVVPTWSATDPRAHGYVFGGTGHGALCTDPSVLNMLGVLMAGDPPSSDVVVS